MGHMAHDKCLAANAPARECLRSSEPLTETKRNAGVGEGKAEKKAESDGAESDETPHAVLPWQAESDETHQWGLWCN